MAPLLLLQGLVKLADFGVAAKLGELEDGKDNGRIAGLLAAWPLDLPICRLVIISGREECSVTLHRAANIAVSIHSCTVVRLTLSLPRSGRDALLDGA